MRATLYLIILFLTFFSASAQQVVTLEEAVGVGLEKNYSIRLAEKNLEISRNENTIGNAGMLPTVDLNAQKNFQRQNVDLELQGPEGPFSISQEGAKSNQFNSSAALNWTIFDGLKMFMAKDRLSEMEKAGELNTRIAIENTVAAISNAYFQIVLEQAKRDVLRQTLDISESRVNLARSRYEVGQGSKMDFLAAQVDLNADKSNLLLQEEILSNAIVDLNYLLGQAVNTKFDVVDEIPLNSGIIYEDMEEKILSSNPQILLSFRNQNVAFLEYKEKLGDRAPSLSVGVSYGYNTQNNEAGQLRSLVSDGLTYGFTASWRIFNGFNTSREIQNARIQREMSEMETEDIRQQLLAELEKTYISYVNSLNLTELEEENVEVAIENEQIALDRYELGASTPLELREAQRNAVDAKTRLLDARLAAKLAEIELMRLSGQLLKGE